MTPFLKQVAAHYFPAEDPGSLCFIFPGKRSVRFFRQHLSEVVKAGGKPVVAPATLTMSDFFYRLTGARKTDRVQLLTLLYDCYRVLNPQAERLDDFIYWGSVLLGDFDDMDKYLVDARKLLTNVSDFKGIQDSYGYLTPTQEEAVRRFVAHFHKKDGPDTGKTDYKQRFLNIWQLLLPLYESFRERLRAEDRSYEGMVYRDLAERLSETPAVDLLDERFPDSRKFVFVGLNALNECEKKVLRKMRDAGLAEFCWDFSSEEIRDPRGKASWFLRENVEAFPQAFRPDPEGLQRPQIKVLNVPSSVGQAARLPRILRELGAHGIETAIVLPDEQLLLPVLNSIPEEIGELNVTMGYPMAGSEFALFFDALTALQAHIRRRDDGIWFYHRQVWSLFSNSLFKLLCTDAGKERVQQLRKAAHYYMEAAEFAGDQLLELVFRPADDPAAYLRELLEFMGRSLSALEGVTVEREFTLFAYKTVIRLQDLRLELLPGGWLRLFNSLLATASVPFKGEPLKGLQIMGPLETRALDFENLVILSCNEGIFPHRSVAASFIPPELRKGFGLPTYEYQDAVWAYYFYRAIQRAGTVWLVCDTRTEFNRSGEESRYIKQLELHYGFPVQRFTAQAPLRQGGAEGEIPKTDEDVRIIQGRALSPTSLQCYLACPAQFYYRYVRRLAPEDEVSESLDAGELGDALHYTMQQLYDGRGRITREDLDALLRDRDRIRRMVEERIRTQMHCFEISGHNLIYRDLICSYVEQILRRDRELLKPGSAIRILGLEREGHVKVDGFHIKGKIDRLDSLGEGEVRVVDYKTGRVSDEEYLIDDDNAEAVVEALFGKDNDKRPKIALQLYIYDLIARSFEETRGKVLVNSLYQTGRLFVQEVQGAQENARFCALMKERLSGLLAELSDPSVPFRRTAENDKTCEWCDFKTLCGR